MLFVRVLVMNNMKSSSAWYMLTFKLKRRGRQLHSVLANHYNLECKPLRWFSVIVHAIKDFLNIIVWESACSGHDYAIFEIVIGNAIFHDGIYWLFQMDEQQWSVVSWLDSISLILPSSSTCLPVNLSLDNNLIPLLKKNATRCSPCLRRSIERSLFSLDSLD